MYKNYKSNIAKTSALLLACLTGYLIGRIIDTNIAYSLGPIQVTTGLRSYVPTVQIEHILNGNLEGNMSPDVRLFLGDTQVFPTTSGSFSVFADVFLANNIKVIIPEGMYFVASKKGKKYYPVTSASANNLVPQNRVYFRTEEEAENAGYTL